MPRDNNMAQEKGMCRKYFVQGTMQVIGIQRIYFDFM